MFFQRSLILGNPNFFSTCLRLIVSPYCTTYWKSFYPFLDYWNSFASFCPKSMFVKTDKQKWVSRLVESFLLSKSPCMDLFSIYTWDIESFTWPTENSVQRYCANYGTFVFDSYLVLGPRCRLLDAILWQRDAEELQERWVNITMVLISPST